MPRGAEYDDGKPHSDNAIEAEHDIVHGGSKSTSEAELSGPKKAAPLPEGMDEMNDRTLSGGAALGHQSGKGGHDPRTMGEHKGLSGHRVVGTADPHPMDLKDDQQPRGSGLPR
ncbi:uncharacterized protein Z520_05050 [Fonsecaea multimorphosa CBS 102226]|uniref:Uncharacterized protein n=1 Tax=Fonsecaea multimorphosa CBS 102226 TaxID=1442371 RepID=A0A0D2K8J6_9EURO|nr:uncharacterized protein Z520_05050 [Fonsecaea multimorphosa CBS 102226]KIX99474.1 hypothetical protein Z520_05050 [Fonsecaea multimorphosa CBS 102226]OAL25469.1 hypothetical protein AYO22_04788 [Fonsecaea multimorphosa]